MSEVRRGLLLFARHPIVGGMKTRLIPALGAEGAAALHPFGPPGANAGKFTVSVRSGYGQPTRGLADRY
jgi:hypothetical protein